MDWEAVDAKLDQVRIDSQLREEEDQVNYQVSREAPEIPEVPDFTEPTTPSTPSSSTTTVKFRSLTKGSSVRSKSAPARESDKGSSKNEQLSEDEYEEDEGRESFQETIKELLGDQEREKYRNARSSNGGQQKRLRGSGRHARTKH